MAVAVTKSIKMITDASTTVYVLDQGACMNESQLVPSDRPLSDVDDDYCLSKGIGFSCLVSKTTRAAIDLTK